MTGDVRTLHGLLEASARGRPNALCLKYGSHKGYTYKDIQEAMEQCARSVVLLKMPVVALVADRSYGLVVGLLGILRAGKAYCPIEPDFPSSRAAIMFETAGIKDVLVPAGQAPDVLSDFNDLNILSVHENGRVTNSSDQPMPVGELPQDVPDDSTAYVLFTSGSTGKPKGCMVPHRGSANYARAVVQNCKLDASTAFVLKTPYVFDVSVQDMFTAFCAGGLLVIAEPGAHKDSAAMADLFYENKVSCCCFVPTLLVEFGNYLAGNQEEARKVGQSLKHILTIGEALMSGTCQQMFEFFPELQVHNLYGPTEASVGVSHQMVTKDTLDLSSAVVPIGKPFDYVNFCVFNASSYEGKSQILASDLLEVIAGEVGELFIGGDCLAQGYIAAPEKTSAAFFDFPQVLPRPASAASKFSLYKTGDLVKKRSDGVFEYLGRNDFQVKISGVRIECEEVSSVLKSHPFVEDALVTAFDGPFGKTLAAYVVASKVADWTAKVGEDAKEEDQEDDVAKWGAVYDEMYNATDDSVSNQDPTLNWSGYVDTYAKKPHIEAVIKEWVEWSCEQVSRHLNPKGPAQTITELGCGNGMLLFRLAPQFCTGKYIGTDISTTALDYVKKMSHRKEYKDLQIQAEQLAAHNIMKLCKEKENDMVLCNGVTMYFPSAEYLVNCMKLAADATRSDGFVIFGDIQSKRHLLPFRCHVEAFHASRRTNSTAVAVLRAAKQAATNEELSYFDDELFHRLDKSGTKHFDGRLARVELRLKRGWWHSEFNRFRYDVELVLCDKHVATKPLDLLFCSFKEVEENLQLKTCPDAAQAVYPESFDLVDPKLAERLPAWVTARLLDLPASKDGLVLKLPNARTLQSVRLMEWLEEGAKAGRHMAELPSALNPLDASRGSVETSSWQGIEPEMLFNMQLPEGWTQRVIWDEDPAFLRFVLLRQEAAEKPWLGCVCAAPSEELPSDLTVFKNRPEDVLAAEDVFDAVKACNDALKAWTAKTQLLPAMQPSIYISMESFPKNTAGKTDRNALPDANEMMQKVSDATTIAYEPPATEDEKKMVQIWESVLKTAVGVNTPFIAYGGHSLTALQLCPKVLAEFGFRPELAFLTSDDCTVRELLARKSGASDESSKTKYVVRLSPPEVRGCNLLIFCAAGTHAQVYKAVAEKTQLMQVYAVELPGRGEHASEPLEMDFKQVMEKLAKPVDSWAETRKEKIWLWGDSLGAVIAYTFACKWQRGKFISPLGLFISGNAGPREAAAECGLGASASTTLNVTSASEMSLSDWVEFLVASAGNKGEEMRAMLKDPALAELSVAPLRADCQVYESYQLDEELVLNMPIMTMRGQRDCITTSQAMQSWLRVAGNRLEHKEFPDAGHMISTECPDTVARHIFQASLYDMSDELSAFKTFRASYRLLRASSLKKTAQNQALPKSVGSPTMGAQAVPQDLNAFLDFGELDAVLTDQITPPTKQVKMMRLGNMEWRKGGYKGNDVNLP